MIAVATYQDWHAGRDWSGGVPAGFVDDLADGIDVPSTPPGYGWSVLDATGPGDPGVYAGYGAPVVDRGSYGVAPKNARGPRS